jgi:hypothetical protein
VLRTRVLANGGAVLDARRCFGNARLSTSPGAPVLSRAQRPSIAAVGVDDAGKPHITELPDERLRALAEHLAPGTSLLVVAVDESSAEFVARELRHFGAEIVRELVDGQVTTEFTSLTASE